MAASPSVDASVLWEASMQPVVISTLTLRRTQCRVRLSVGVYLGLLKRYQNNSVSFESRMYLSPNAVSSLTRAELALRQQERRRVAH